MLYFLLRAAIIVLVSHAAGWVATQLRQPRVIGEMAAGIALGPTLLGALAPVAYHVLFPPESLGALKVLSQIGLVIFIFVVGLRVDLSHFRRQTSLALLTSIVSIAITLGSGMALARHLYPRYGSGDVLTFALFLGTAISVTAFPVLARILMERGLLDTSVGSAALACAAIDGFAVWILLAVIVGMAGHAKADWSSLGAPMAAFVAGLMAPRRLLAEWFGSARRGLDKLEALTLALLIPLFFALTGIRTNLIFSFGGAYFDLTLILVVAIASKWGGAVIGARWSGMAWRDASRLGIMLNTRGLVELIVLNAGLDAGILSPELFSMLVCMALITTLMTAPLISSAP